MYASLRKKINFIISLVFLNLLSQTSSIPVTSYVIEMSRSSFQLFIRRSIISDQSSHVKSGPGVITRSDHSNYVMVLPSFVKTVRPHLPCLRQMIVGINHRHLFYWYPLSVCFETQIDGEGRAFWESTKKRSTSSSILRSRRDTAKRNTKLWRC